MKFSSLFLITVLYYNISNVISTKLQPLYEWKYLNLTPLPSEYKNSNITIPFNSVKAVPTDVDMSQDGRVFVAVVAKPNVRVSLTTVSNDSHKDIGLLKPYPNYFWYLNVTNCNNITNVRSMTIDKCNRLWALDDGKIDRTQICPAKLLVFDLETNELLKKFEIPRNIHENLSHRGVLVNPVVNVTSCKADIQKINVYISDAEGYALVLFNDKEFRRLDGQQYSYTNSEIKFNVANETFNLPGGILALDLEPEGEQLFFANLASRNLSILNVKELNDVFNGKKEPKATVVQSFFSSQPTSLRWSKDNVLFVGLAESSIVCWKKANQFCSDNFDVVIEDVEKLQYISTLKIVQNRNLEETLLTISNRIQKSINRNRSQNEINFRILTTSVKDLLRGTKCNEEVKNNCNGKLYETKQAT